MNIRITIFALTIFISSGQAQNSPHEQANIHQFVVEEVLQTSSYTYLLANENGSQQWLALPKIAASVGETYYYSEGIEMKDFRSTELDRIFASVLFLQGIQSAQTIAPQNNVSQNDADGVQNQKIEQAEGGITIAELMANKDSYDGKTVRLKGKVVKYNAAIMGKNWIHIQDGTGEEGDNDLTVTTDMISKVGDIITVEGIITINKDFGAGYFYKIIMEEAKITKDI